VSIVDSNCSPVAYQSGDANGNNVLDTNETMTFTCTKTFTSGGAMTTNVVGKGTSAVDNRAVDDELASVSVTIAQPHAVLTKSVAPTRGTAPVRASYSYSYRNDGRDALSDLRLSDDRCTNVTFSGGDANGDHLVQPGERWTFTCAQTFNQAGVFPNVVTATAIDVVDKKPVGPLRATAEVVVVAPAVTTLPTADTSPPRVLGEQVARPPTRPRTGPSFFARTGVRVATLVVAGVLSLIVGWVLVGVGRRRRQAT
jgi:hypothetical protein